MKKLRILLPILLLILFGTVQFYGWIPVIDNLIYDDLMLGERQTMENIIIVGMDDRSMREIGTWPWPRFFMADAIEKLTEYGAAAIGANVLYLEYGANKEYDERLVAAAAATDRLVIAGQAFMDTRDFAAEDYIYPFEALAEVVSIGFVNVRPDDDGVLRRALGALRYGDITIHSLPLEVYRTYCRVMGKPDNIDSIPFDDVGKFPIRYAGRPGSFTKVSLWGVINDEYNPELFKDAIVLIGPYAQGIGEGNFTTPLDRRTATYGIEINANIIQNLIEGSFKQDAEWWLDLSIMAFMGLLVTLFLPRMRPIPAVVLTLGLIAVQLAGAKIVYDQLDIILKAGDTVIFLLVCFVVNLVLGIMAALREKNHIHGLFGRFVAPEVVSELMSGGADIQLGGVVREITVLFVDIRGFTAFSENNPPEKVVGMVNRYLALTSRAIQENGGTIDKYIGDATMAVFNAPNDVPDHAMKAVKAAWAMKCGAINLQGEILRDYGVDLQFGIGVNTGYAVVGNMGSEFRMDYTAIGDTVNTAARIESNAQKGQIILSDATYQQVKDRVEVTDLGVLNVKNKKVGIQIYELDFVQPGGRVTQFAKF
jgi:adenylate cyclase